MIKRYSRNKYIFDNKDLYIKKYKSLRVIQKLYKKRYLKKDLSAIIIQRWIIKIGYNHYNKNVSL
jgi:hypothetical protein